MAPHALSIENNDYGVRVGDYADTLCNNVDNSGAGLDDNDNSHHDAALNGVSINETNSSYTPIAICGMACRLPGGIKSPQQLWNFLMAKGDAKSRVPKSRYNIDAYLSDSGKPGTIKCPYGYFLDEDLAALDASFFSMTPGELERVDPQHRQLLEVARECIEDAGETDWKGQNIGVFTGNFGDDWIDMLEKDIQQHGIYRILGGGDFGLPNRVSYEMGLSGPSMHVRTACSAGMSALHQACTAIARGECKSAIVGGTSLILNPSMTSRMTEQGILAVDGSCKTFSADANGYARGEAINALYIKSLADARRDGNPVRAVIRGSAINSDGKTPSLLQPSTDSQEALMRHAYKIAGITDFSETAFVECHGTGTPVGDPIETKAVARVFGKSGIHITSVKPNVGHSEGASGLTSVIKAVMALENRTIPPNINFATPNPNIPFEDAKLQVPTEAVPWPASKRERVSINSFGIGGANAHVILDSAADHSARIEPVEASDASQLLLFSANTSESLTKIAENYSKFLADHPERIEDVAFTLSNRREHLQHRAFMVASREQPGMVSPAANVKAGDKRPNLVMVFTGQGAQWPQMGRDLVRSNAVFKNTIKSLDQYLKKLGESGPEWTMEAELRKPAKTSKLGLAELSQPLCTAVQVALVDSLAAVGIVPDAVVGHSSGEIGAAYASGALTAEEAITSAFFRGAITKKQSRHGAMAAIGLGWDEVKQFLVPGVGVACENSPKSVTLSGDADKVGVVVGEIENAKPGVLARLLKVDKAYHSHHMVEIGEDYHSLIEPYVQGKFPTKPFFSSVTGKLLKPEEKLNARYWQKNLESPVLFKGAVATIAQHPIGQNAVFIEIGPHSALAGPVRQILMEHGSGGSTAPYVSAMLRAQNCTETLLSAIGKLWTLQVPIDHKSLHAKGTCLPDLPRYPWNRAGSHWYETRVSKDWRFREHRHHDLLGARSLECTDLEPSWRNLFHLDSAPWVRDHKVRDDIVFPFAGYAAMAGEAIRQLSGEDHGYRIRNMLVHTALVVSDEKPVEIVTNLRSHRLTNSLDSQWWEYTILSHNGHRWVKHCTGEVTSLAEALGSPRMPSDQLPRAISAKTHYKAFTETGMVYEPHFQVLNDIRTSTTFPGEATANIKNGIEGDEAEYFLHPTIVDAALQLICCGAFRGVARKYRKQLVTSIGDLCVSRCSSDVAVRSSANLGANGAVTGMAEYTADGQVVVRMTNTKFTVLDEPAKADTHAAARHTWGRDIEFANVSKLFMPKYARASYAQILEELTQLCLLHSHQTLAGKQSQVTHLKKYHSWIDSQVAQMGADAIPWKQLNSQCLIEEINVRVKQLKGTPAFDAAVAMSTVCTANIDILSGEQEGAAILQQDDLVGKVQTLIDGFETSKFLQCLAHSRPNLRVLELGAGTGSSTVNYLQSLGARYLKYTFSDVTSVFFGEAKDRLKGSPNLDFAVLDISKDLEEQNFTDVTYDLVIANNVLHQSDNLRQSLTNARSLLHPQGRLLIQDFCSSSKWVNYIFGVLPSWWRGVSDSRNVEPYLSLKRWREEILDSGFEKIDVSITDTDEPFQLNCMLVARPEATRAAPKKISVLRDSNVSTTEPLVSELERRGYEVSYCTVDDVPSAGQDIIANLDKDAPYLTTLTSESYARFHKFLNQVSESKAGLFWVTPLSPKCEDPRYAQVVGLARTMRSEMEVDFAVCQIDGKSQERKIVDVFQKFQTREHDGTLKPEMEYSIVKGEVHVGRFTAFVLRDEMKTANPTDRAVLHMEKLGKVGDLKWSSQVVQPAPVGDEVEIKVHSSGLNSRDVQVATGATEPASISFGLEAAGVVTQIGPDVKNLVVGDRVVCFGRAAFASSMTESEQLCVRIPDELDYNYAAAMSTAYITAIYSLINVGQLEAGQSVLIHGGCGGVGLASIQIARMIGADIFTTVSSHEKVEYLMETFNLPRNRIFQSRDASFVEDIMRETGGKGVEVVLNSLSGELLHATWRCVAEFGKMVELGRKDITGAAKLDMDMFLQNRSYACIDMDRIRSERPAIIARLLNSMIRFYNEGHIQLIRLDKVFKAVEIQDAFRHLQQSQHIGKIVVELDGVESEAASRKLTATFDPAASYLLVGGLGGLGRAISVWMIEHGARNLIYLSRSAGLASPDQEAFVHEIETMGCHVQLVQGSVSDLADVTRAVTQARAPLKGILQMSMVLRDQSFPKMTWNDWETAVSPKVQGTWNLHEATRAAGITLDFFVLFSSLSGIIGQVGQANYASANTFLDAFCQYRRSLGLAASAIDIGAVEGIGVLAANETLLRAMKAGGFHALREPDLLDALTLATAPQTPSSSIPSSFVLGLASSLPLSHANNRALWRADPRMAVYHTLKSTTDSAPAGTDALKSFLVRARSDPSVLEDAETPVFFARQIGRKLLALLMQPQPDSDEEVKINLGLADLGMESLVAMEMRTWWKGAFGFDVSVLEMLGMGTLEILGRHVVERLKAR